LTRFVLDASVSLAWFLDDPTPELALRVRRCLDRGGLALVPTLWVAEMANGFAMVERRGLLSRSAIDRSIDEIEGLLDTAIDPHGASTISLRQGFAVASTFRLTAYHAAYLETARRENLPLATLDRELLKAARDAGVPLFS
jgi:predicted nucleic acid-binding protein